MNYFTAMASSPVYEFPYSGYQTHSLPNFDTDIDALLSTIAPPLGDLVYNQPPTITLQCTPQINAGIGNNTIVYQVPEDTPIETILQQLGVDSNTLQSSNTLNNYYRSASQPIELLLPRSSSRRRLICREVSDSEDDSYDRRPLDRHRSSGPNQSPGALHDLLSRVWDNAKRGSKNLPTSSSAPNLNSQWQAMRNARPEMSQNPQSAVNSVWHKANYASDLNARRLSDMDNRMRRPTGGMFPPPQPPPQNREAVQNFLAARNLPYGINLPPPPPPQNREAVQNFLAARNLPYGINLPPPPQQNREAAQNFLAARNLPYGINLPPPPPQNREAVQNFLAARNLPYGINASPPPQQNREAAQNFLAARNLPYGINASPPPQQNQAAVQNFLAARNLPYGINASPPPQQNQAAVQNFLAARNLPYGINASPPPQQNREAVQNFFAARNLPYGINQPNSAVANVWNRADYAAQHLPPPMGNVPWNQMPPPSPPPSPVNTAWNRMQQGGPLPLNPSYLNSPYGAPQQSPGSVPAPPSFATLLAQAHQQRLPYAGAA